MSRSTSNRLLAVVVASLLFVSYLATRDTIRVEGDLSRNDVKAIVSGVQEWSSPKLFRHIEIRPGDKGTITAWVRERGNRWSVTIYTNSVGAWLKCGWYLVEEDWSKVTR